MKESSVGCGIIPGEFQMDIVDAKRLVTKNHKLLALWAAAFAAHARHAAD